MPNINTKTEKCLTCNGKGIIPVHWPPTLIKGDRCPACKGVKTIEVPIKETHKLEFSDRTRDIPDSPGIWFYHATGVTTMVIRKENGNLYFRNPFRATEEIEVAEFASDKDNSSIEIDNDKFTKLTRAKSDDDFDLSTP